MSTGWKSVQKVSSEYLMGRGTFTIVETTLTSKKSDEFKKMFAWCEKSSNDCWSVAQLENYSGNITWRFYDDSIAQKFKKKFKKYIIESSS